MINNDNCFQGVNRIAAIALLVLEEEEDAFWCLIAIIEHFMPKDYYANDIEVAYSDQVTTVAVNRQLMTDFLELVDVLKVESFSLRLSSPNVGNTPK